jgi:hypothetical protein
MPAVALYLILLASNDAWIGSGWNPDILRMYAVLLTPIVFKLMKMANPCEIQDVQWTTSYQNFLSSLETNHLSTGRAVVPWYKKQLHQLQEQLQYIVSRKS